MDPLGVVLNMKRTVQATVAAAAGALTLAPAAASADTYSVYSCRDPLGAANPAAGWVGSQTGTGAASNACSSGGGLVAQLGGALPPGDSSAAWRFDAPIGTRIVRVAARRETTGLRRSGQTFDVAYALATNVGLPGTATLEACAPSTESSCVADLGDIVDKQGLNGATLSFRALCTNSGGVCSGPLAVRVGQVAVGLQDPAAPVVTGARLLDDGDRSGRLTVGFNAADVGGGLYRTIVKVDGRAAQHGALGAAPCADLAPADRDAYQFNVPVPCPRALSGRRVTVDTRALPPGPHGVEIAVEDAAGNETAVFGPVEFPRPNLATGSSVPIADILRGRLQMWFVKAPRRGTRLTSRFGTRVVVRGVLRTRSGRGIQGARVDVYHIRRDGTRRLVKTGLKSRAAGRLTLILPNNVDTRTIEFAFRAVRPGPITSRQRLRLTVRTRGGRIYHRATGSRR